MHDENCFITLTYNDDKIPEGETLEYRDYQLFMKSLRKKLRTPVRFFMCGEYGSQTRRPHYHAILFGHAFREDRYPWKKSNTSQLWRSPTLEQLWTHGDSNIGEVTFESAAYVARYVVDKITGTEAPNHYGNTDPGTGEITFRLPEFCHMSLKPGIGSTWFNKYRSDVKDGKVVVRGHESNIPKYYKRKLTEEEQITIQSNLDESIDYKDQSWRRLEDKEQVAKARNKQLRRTL